MKVVQNGGSTQSYRINIWDNNFNNIGIDVGDGISFTLTEEKVLRCSIMIIKGTKVDNLLFRPLLYKGTFDSNKKYEQFGAMPSPKFFSEIECVTGNIDIKKINNISNFTTEASGKTNGTNYCGLRFEILNKYSSKISGRPGQTEYRVGGNYNSTKILVHLDNSKQYKLINSLNLIMDITVVNSKLNTYRQARVRKDSVLILEDDEDGISSIRFEVDTNTTYDNTILEYYIYDKEETEIIHLNDLKLYGDEKARDEFVKKANGWYLIHNWKRYVFDGSENWQLAEASNAHNFTLSGLKIPFSPRWDTIYLKCNRFKFINTFLGTDITKMYVDTAGKLVVTIASGDEKYCETVEDFKTLLQEWNTEGNNLEIVYLLSEPEIEKITDTELIEDLEKLSKTKTYEGVNHIDSDSIAYLKLEYMQSNKILNQRKDEKIKNIESRLALLEV